MDEVFAQEKTESRITFHSDKKKKKTKSNRLKSKPPGSARKASRAEAFPPVPPMVRKDWLSINATGKRASGMFENGKGSAILAEMPPRKKRACDHENIENINPISKSIDAKIIPIASECPDSTEFVFSDFEPFLSQPADVSETSTYFEKKKEQLAQLANTNERRATRVHIYSLLKEIQNSNRKLLSNSTVPTWELPTLTEKPEPAPRSSHSRPVSHEDLWSM